MWSCCVFSQRIKPGGKDNAGPDCGWLLGFTRLTELFFLANTLLCFCFPFLLPSFLLFALFSLLLRVLCTCIVLSGALPALPSAPPASSAPFSGCDICNKIQEQVHTNWGNCALKTLCFFNCKKIRADAKRYWTRVAKHRKARNLSL